MAPGVQWPTGERAQAVVSGFKDMRGIDGVIGAIDGTHISISAPKKEPADYINRKGFHSLNFQAVCDHTTCFTDIFAGYPGKVHDARVFKNSPLFESVSGHGGPFPFPDNTFIIGDGAYPLSPRVLTPFRDTGRLTVEQQKYNKLHSSTRMVIERSFGLVKGRFRRLKHMDMKNTECIIKFVVGACVLHNMCVREGEACMEVDVVDDDVVVDADGREMEEEVTGVCRRLQIMQGMNV
jgi:hypothetical protein